MSEVDWSGAPLAAVCFASGSFRDNKGDWWDGESFRNGGFTDQEIVNSLDFEHRPDEYKDENYYKLQYETWDSVCTPEATPDVTTEGDKSKWTAAHYDNYYQLTEADIKAGKVKIDAYFVNKMWKLNQKDDTGGLFHSLKTIARFGEKNTIERELKALYNQTKRMAELYGVEL